MKHIQSEVEVDISLALLARNISHHLPQQHPKSHQPQFKSNGSSSLRHRSPGFRSVTTSFCASFSTSPSCLPRWNLHVMPVQMTIVLFSSRIRNLRSLNMRHTFQLIRFCWFKCEAGASSSRSSLLYIPRVHLLRTGHYLPLRSCFLRAS